MKYFEVLNPYYALLKAKNEESAGAIYKETIWDPDEDEEDDFEIIEVTQKKAFSKVREAIENFPDQKDSMLNDLNGKEEKLILMEEP